MKMMRQITLLLLVVVIGNAAASLRRVCYYTNWAQYRNGPGKFYPENVEPSLCTHIIYAFAKLNGNHLAAFEWNDESTQWMRGMYQRFYAIKQSNPSIKLLLAIGGWNMGSPPFTRLVSSAANRLDFARTTVKFLRDHNFDGLDMDWEYPANRGSPPGDRPKYTQVLQTLHEEFNRESIPPGKDRLMLTAAVAAGKEKIDTAYEIPAISQYLDMINLMTYDLHGSWETHTGHHSGLCRRAADTGDDIYLNVDWAVREWVRKGAPRDKINVGVPLYGRTVKLTNGHSSDAVGSSSKGAGTAGTYTREAGFLAYYEVCQKLAQGATKHYIPEQRVPYFVQGDLWCGYEDPDSIKIKVDYIKQGGYGGVMVWSLDLDDFSGMCNQGKYPLMKALINEINAPARPQQNYCSGHINPFTSMSTKSTTAATTTTTTRRLSTVTATRMNTSPRHHTQPIAVKTTSSTPTTTASHIPPSHLNPCQGKSDGFYPDTNDCAYFYQCSYEIAYHEPCPTGTYFSATLSGCDWIRNVPCP